jgi:hypothetical protein
MINKYLKNVQNVKPENIALIKPIHGGFCEVQTTIRTPSQTGIAFNLK